MLDRVHALVYASRATTELTDAELDLVLIRSRTLNALRGITGALLKSGDRIVQYLEGEASAVERTFERIRASRLHVDVAVIAQADGVPRQFDTWHMGFRDFQRRHQRAASNDAWIDALAPGRAASTENAALARLLREWDDFFGPGRSG
ncbi:hypothetical protein GCM10027188_09370 [Lysobacter humi (ex Lee et al. 2017)]